MVSIVTVGCKLRHDVSPRDSNAASKRHVACTKVGRRKGLLPQIREELNSFDHLEWASSPVFLGGGFSGSPTKLQAVTEAEYYCSRNKAEPAGESVTTNMPQAGFIRFPSHFLMTQPTITMSPLR